jgi:hypothetical protein
MTHSLSLRDPTPSSDTKMTCSDESPMNSIHWQEIFAEDVLAFGALVGAPLPASGRVGSSLTSTAKPPTTSSLLIVYVRSLLPAALPKIVNLSLIYRSPQELAIRGSTGICFSPT